MGTGAVSSGRSSAVVAQPVGSQTKPTILARVALSVREMFFTSADLQKPDRLYQVIHQVQQNLSKALRVLGSNRQLSGNEITGITCTAGTQFIVSHGLGRPYVGFYATYAHGAPAQFTVILPSDVGYPPGVTTSQVLVLVTGNTGTYNLWIY